MRWEVMIEACSGATPPAITKSRQESDRLATGTQAFTAPIPLTATVTDERIRVSYRAASGPLGWGETDREPTTTTTNT
jgi:hypothetical protein